MSSELSKELLALMVELRKENQEVKVMPKEPEVKCVVAHEESLEEMVDRLNTDQKNFVTIEALKIYRCTDNDAVALEALRLIYNATRDF